MLVRIDEPDRDKLQLVHFQSPSSMMIGYVESFLGWLFPSPTPPLAPQEKMSESHSSEIEARLQSMAQKKRLAKKAEIAKRRAARTDETLVEKKKKATTEEDEEKDGPLTVEESLSDDESSIQKTPYEIWAEEAEAKLKAAKQARIARLKAKALPPKPKKLKRKNDSESEEAATPEEKDDDSELQIIVKNLDDDDADDSLDAPTKKKQKSSKKKDDSDEDASEGDDE